MRIVMLFVLLMFTVLPLPSHQARDVKPSEPLVLTADEVKEALTADSAIKESFNAILTIADDCAGKELSAENGLICQGKIKEAAEKLRAARQRGMDLRRLHGKAHNCDTCKYSDDFKSLVR